MKDKVFKNSFYKVSEIEPEMLRKFMLNEVGEKSKEKLYNYLRDLAESYPEFDKWFYEIVIPEVEKKDDKREIIIVLSELSGENKVVLSGIAILKRTDSERKICTFRVHEEYRNLGIGTALFEECFIFLNTRKPIITISSDRIEMFKKHIENYGFVQKQVLTNYYKQGSDEYVYNGTLERA